MTDARLDAALRLHRYLLQRHWSDGGLVGPDPGIRFNYRMGRFIKSYVGGRFWRDDLYYTQAQGYWTLGNWFLHARLDDDAYRQVAVRCAETMLDRQRDDGAWEYPNPEWRGRVATAEGTWGSLGLLETYRRTGDRRFLEGALKWHDFLIRSVGFQRDGDTAAVNYFAGRRGGRVPNNSAFVLRFLAELADVTGDDAHLEHGPALLRFLDSVQRATGEIPYVAPGADDRGEEHFQCFQYNAFECLDLMRYFDLAGASTHETPPSLVGGLLRFLRGGLAPQGYVFYQCGATHRTVTYHTAVVAAAFLRASAYGADGYQGPADLAWDYVLGQQRPDGSFPYSRGDYRVLRDERSYPRYLAMILVHLLTEQEPARPASAAMVADHAGRKRG